MGGIASVLYGIFSYLVFLGAILYAIAFVLLVAFAAQLVLHAAITCVHDDYRAARGSRGQQAAVR